MMSVINKAVMAKSNEKNILRVWRKNLKVKYKLEESVKASGIYECTICGDLVAFKKGETFKRCEDCVNHNRKRINQWYTTNDFIHFFSKNLELEFDRIIGLQLKVAEKMTEWAGNVWFVTFHFFWFLFWIMANLGYFGQGYVFDPYPFGLLTMIVSLEAIFLSTFIMISQNISGRKAEFRAEHEYQVNLNTEKQVAEIHAMLKELSENKK
jgi:uncharacterized membrane protein